MYWFHDMCAVYVCMYVNRRAKNYVAQMVSVCMREYWLYRHPSLFLSKEGTNYENI